MGLKEEALKALNDLPSLRQAVGTHGVALRRCKPGSKRHREVWDAMTRLENEACEASSTIRLALSRLDEE